MILASRLSDYIAKSSVFSADKIKLTAESVVEKTDDFTGLISSYLMRSLNIGAHTQRMSGSGSQFWQYREYRDGDTTQNIDWKKSARSDSYYVREKEWEKAQHVAVNLSHAPSMHYQSKGAPLSKYQYGSILAYILAQKFCDAGEIISISDTPYISRQSARFLPELADHFTASDYSGGHKQMSDISRAFPFIISDFWDDIDDIKEQISLMRHNHLPGMLIQVCDPDELSFPFKGRLLVNGIGAEGELNITVNRAQNLRSDYIDRIELHCNELRALAQNNNFLYLRVDTNYSLEKLLHDIYQSLCNRSSVKHASEV